MQIAYGYVDAEGLIDISTVSPTEKAAKVNTIVTGSYGHVVPKNHNTDEEIDLMLLNVTGGVGAVVELRVEVWK